MSAAGAGARSRICFVAFGTRGDVQPLAVLATALADAHGGHAFAVTFVTHAAHAPLLDAPLRASGVQLAAVSSLPAAAWRGEAHAHAAADAAWHSDPLAREECVHVVAASFSASGVSSGGALLVFNLFALEGWHLAERLRVPAVAAAPYVVPYAAPPAFLAAFHRALPELSQALRAAPPGALSWHDLEHWAWPLWTERWGDWRADRLRLPSLPLAPEDAPPPPLPRATPLLYGFSEAVVPRPGYWPDSVTITGAWHAPPGWEAGGGAYEPPAALLAFLEAPGAPVACVTFGSMASVDGAIPFPRTTLRGIAAALEAAGLRGVMLMDAGTALAATWRAGRTEAKAAPAAAAVLECCTCGGWGHMLGVSASVPHDWLLPRCVVVLHHAGSGTVAAALRAGVPQVTLPLMFDQHTWAEKLTWLGVAPPPLSRERVLAADPRGTGVTQAVAADVTAALRAALAPAMTRRAAELGAELRAEDGVAVAVAALTRKAATGDAAAAAAAASELLAPADDAPAAQLTRVTLPGGLSLLAVSPEETVFLHSEIFVHDVYLRRGIAAALPRGACVLDVGANIGLFSLRLASLFVSRGDDAATVWALEPLPACYEALTANTRAMSCVHCVRAGVVASAAPGQHADFTFFPQMAGNSTLQPLEKAALQAGAVPAHFWAGAAVISCPVTTLSAFMAAHLRQEQRVSLLKLDVEGSELDAMRGVTAADWCRIDAVVAEVHDTEGRPDAAVQLLRSAGFARVCLDWDYVLAAAGGPPGCVMLYAQRAGLNNSE